MTGTAAKDSSAESATKASTSDNDRPGSSVVALATLRLVIQLLGDGGYLFRTGDDLLRIGSHRTLKLPEVDPQLVDLSLCTLRGSVGESVAVDMAVGAIESGLGRSKLRVCSVAQPLLFANDGLELR